MSTLRRAIAVRIARNVSKNGAPERIRTADPQIRSLVRTVEIIEVRYRKKLVGRVST
jgi:hypothetical protein